MGRWQFVRTVTVVYHQEAGTCWAESPDIPEFTAVSETLHGARELVPEFVKVFGASRSEWLGSLPLWGWIDPGCFGQIDDLGDGAIAEALGISGVGGGQGGPAFEVPDGREAVVHLGWGVEADAGMPVVVVVAVDEVGHEGLRIGQGAEPFREGGGVLQGLEPRF